jgi:nicotinate-nucleotide--dimethylbenzimidazole phosphoribosyltransferase
MSLESNASYSASAAQAKMDQKTKPLGALGELENLALQLCEIQQNLNPKVDPARAIIFAADHGVAAEGVSLFPQAVTAQMVLNFVNGGAAIAVLARTFDVDLEIVDVGVLSDFDRLLPIVHEKVARGSHNLLTQTALPPEQLTQALAVGAQRAVQAKKQGIRTLVLGEMGIANTTSAAALVCAFTGLSPEEIVGAGTGVTGAHLQLKIDVVRRALARVQGASPQAAQSAVGQATSLSARAILAELGGLEIAALVGAMIEAQALGLIVVVDGFIASAAALAAVRLHPPARAHMVFAHQSAERGHQAVLAALDAKPLLNLGLRLGEGSGALLALPLLRAASAIMAEMASFASAGVSQA